MLEFALDMIEALNQYNRTNEFLITRGLSLSLRVGVNTGPVVAVCYFSFYSLSFF